MAALMAPLVATPTSAACCQERALSELPVGAVARVARVEGDTTDASRLKALGVCEGRLLEVLRTGDAWVVRVLGSRIGVSRQLAASVWLTAA